MVKGLKTKENRWFKVASADPSVNSERGRSKLRRILIVCTLLAVLMLTLSGCMATSTFYTARTLDQGKFAPGFGADDIFVKSTDNSVTVSKGSPFVPSFLFAYGLPLRLEADARFVIPRLLEVSLRDQINPRSFELFDFSPDITFGDLFGGYTYLRYGTSLSKDIGSFEPYIHYSY
ncbi:MAG: hypothetical protein M1470_06395 [Bacteroidetes bacterium]|nr:hypothetical protein [Bacteroidota bacterium]MCL5739139.1 hypothetical protein [Bacteroidota bacterium]